MKIAMIGYGKMGHIIENIAKTRGHNVFSIDSFDNGADFFAPTSEKVVQSLKQIDADIAIEFTHPSSVISNMQSVFSVNIPMVVGTTGWYNRMSEVEEMVKKSESTLFWAGNFSIGVNMFYRIVENATKLMSEYDEYDVAVTELHHNQKADSPSGTALEIARRIMAQNTKKTEIVDGAFRTKPKSNQLHISSTRIGSMPGVHTVYFDSPFDTIELTHTVRNREGLALGAVRVAEWLFVSLKNGTLSKAKIYTMDDFLSTH